VISENGSDFKHLVLTTLTRVKVIKLKYLSHDNEYHLRLKYYLSDSETTSPPVSTVLVRNTTGGAQLLYKSSGSNSNNLTFDGHFLSSSSACGTELQTCPTLAAIRRNDFFLIAVPLQQFIGLAAFGRNNGSLELQQTAIVTLNSQDLECNVLSISGISSDRSVALLANCVYNNHRMSGSGELDLIQIIVDVANISDVSLRTLTDSPCRVNQLSGFEFLMSPHFENGIIVFASDTRIMYDIVEGTYCNAFQSGGIDECTNVRWLSKASSEFMALYCFNRTFLFNLVNNRYTPFTRDADGLPLFCSETDYYTYSNGSLTRRHNDVNRTQLGPAVDVQGADLTAGEEVVWGSCILGEFVVLYTSAGNVAIYQNSCLTSFTIGRSETVPRIFDNFYVLLKMSGQAQVYDIRTRERLDYIDQDFDLAHVFSDSLDSSLDGSLCDTTSPPSSTREVTSLSSSTEGISTVGTTLTDQVSTSNNSQNRVRDIVLSVIVPLVMLAVVVAVAVVMR